MSTSHLRRIGRLRKVQVAGGAANGAQIDYQLNAVGNRIQYVVSGSPGSGSITITAVGNTANQTSNGVVLGVNVAGATPATGTVAFAENGVFLGRHRSTTVTPASFWKALSLGLHTITVSYSGDSANAPYSYTFTIRVQNLSWLPAVLQILLSE